MQVFSLSAQFARESAMLKLPEERRRWGKSKGAGRGQGERSVFFSPLPSPLSFFRPSSYRKGYYFYSPQSSTVINSKMAATTILRTRTRFRPPKIRLQCRLLSMWTAATLFSSLMFACYFSSLLAKYNLIKVLKCS